MLSFALDPHNEMRESSGKHRDGNGTIQYLTGDTGLQNRDENGTYEEEYEENRASDLAEMEPAKQQVRIKKHAFFLISVGIALIIVFAYPIVCLLSEIGER